MTTTERRPPARHRLRLAGVRLCRGWEPHPGVRSNGELSVGERAADGVRDEVVQVREDLGRLVARLDAERIVHRGEAAR